MASGKYHTKFVHAEASHGHVRACLTRQLPKLSPGVGNCVAKLGLASTREERGGGGSAHGVDRCKVEMAD